MCPSPFPQRDFWFRVDMRSDADLRVLDALKRIVAPDSAVGFWGGALTERELSRELRARAFTWPQARIFGLRSTDCLWYPWDQVADDVIRLAKSHAAPEIAVHILWMSGINPSVVWFDFPDHLFVVDEHCALQIEELDGVERERLPP